MALFVERLNLVRELDLEEKKTGICFVKFHLSHDIGKERPTLYVKKRANAMENSTLVKSPYFTFHVKKTLMNVTS
jgi:hypothetical protein